jgi:hypothetical protein
MSFHSRPRAFRQGTPFNRVAAVALSFGFAIREPRIINRRVEQLAARRVHTPEVAGSSPASATRFRARLGLAMSPSDSLGAFFYSDVARRDQRRAFFRFVFGRVAPSLSILGFG